MSPGRPLNVVRIISFLTVGGVQSMLLATLPHFDRSRFNIRVCCTTRSGEVGQALEAAGVPVNVVKVRSRLHPVDLWRLSRWLKAQSADIVHTHMYASNISGVLAARLAALPVIVSHIHSDHEWHGESRIRMERFCDRFRSAHVAVSGAVRDAFLQKTGLPPDRVRVMHNAARPPRSGSSDPAPLRAELGIPDGCPVIGTVSRLVPVKALDLLVRAARHVVDARTEARFVLVGRGRERDDLQRLVDDLSLHDRVILTGERLDVEAFYRLFDVFALSSRTEGCPNVILEAMGRGVPIVATRVGGVPELVRDGHSGLLVPFGDDQALAAAILRVLDDADLAQRLAEQAQQDVREYTVPNYVAKMEKLYTELYTACRGPRP